MQSTYYTKLTDKRAYGNNFQPWLPLMGFERGKLCIHYWAPENHILYGLRIVFFVSYSNCLINNYIN